MPRHFEKKRLPYTPQQMFDLVRDVERYPEFLPWCIDAKVYDVSDDKMTADLVVGNAHFKESFTSIVTITDPEKISVSYGGGSLKHLSNEWTFLPTNDGQGCEVHFLVDFSLRSRLLGAMMELFFHKAFHRMVAAFEQRAEQKYRK